MGDMRSMTPDVGTAVAVKLTELQGERSDAEMAKLLGCSRMYWWRIRNHKSRPSYTLVKRAAVTFPDVLRIVMRDLTEGAA